MRIKEFLKAWWSDWLTRMSGPLTVPFAILALYVSSQSFRVLYAVLAIVCAIYTSYRIWLTERLRVETLTHELGERQNRRPYDDERQGRAQRLLEGCSVRHRDLLRFVLLHQSPTAQAINGSTKLSSQEVTQDIQQLEREDILRREERRVERLYQIFRDPRLV